MMRNLNRGHKPRYLDESKCTPVGSDTALEDEYPLRIHDCVCGLHGITSNLASKEDREGALRQCDSTQAATATVQNCKHPPTSTAESIHFYSTSMLHNDGPLSNSSPTALHPNL